MSVTCWAKALPAEQHPQGCSSDTVQCRVLFLCALCGFHTMLMYACATVLLHDFGNSFDTVQCRVLFLCALCGFHTMLMYACATVLLHDFGNSFDTVQCRFLFLWAQSTLCTVMLCVNITLSSCSSHFVWYKNIRSAFLALCLVTVVEYWTCIDGAMDCD